MKKAIALLLLVSNAAISAEAIKLNRADHSFDTFIRVQMPARIVDGPNLSLIGKSSPYVQSLSYTSSKTLQLSLQFNNEAEIITYMHEELCNEFHEVTLKPVGVSGTKGVNSFDVKMKPKIVSVEGVVLSERSQPFNQSLICKNNK